MADDGKVIVVENVIPDVPEDSDEARKNSLADLVSWFALMEEKRGLRRSMSGLQKRMDSQGLNYK